MARNRRRKRHTVFTFTKSQKRAAMERCGISNRDERRAKRMFSLNPSQRTKFKSLFGW